MRTDDYNRAENACRIGLAFTLLAALLNLCAIYFAPHAPGAAVAGVSLAAVSLGCAYFAETFYLWISDRQFMRLAVASIVSSALSFAAWLITFV